MRVPLWACLLRYPSTAHSFAELESGRRLAQAGGTGQGAPTVESRGPLNHMVQRTSMHRARRPRRTCSTSGGAVSSGEQKGSRRIGNAFDVIGRSLWVLEIMEQSGTTGQAISGDGERDRDEENRDRGSWEPQHRVAITRTGRTLQRSRGASFLQRCGCCRLRRLSGATTLQATMLWICAPGAFFALICHGLEASVAHGRAQQISNISDAISFRLHRFSSGPCSGANA